MSFSLRNVEKWDIMEVGLLGMGGRKMCENQHNNKSTKRKSSRTNLQTFGESRNRGRRVTSSREGRIKNGKPTGNPPEE